MVGEETIISLLVVPGGYWGGRVGDGESLTVRSEYEDEVQGGLSGDTGLH